MHPLNGPGAPSSGNRQSSMPPPEKKHPPSDTQPLSPDQRTTLERLIMRIMSISPLKSVELWAGIRHEVGVNGDAELLAIHFPTAEKYLNQRLAQEQKTHAERQLQQQLTDLLTIGNNRQAVSDFIRQQFGHTVLSSLNAEQLREVLTMLQNGQMEIPLPQQNTVTNRSLLPAEHQALNQQIARLVAVTGDSPARLWDDVLNIAQVPEGAPIPVLFFPVLTQYLQASIMLRQQATPTLEQFITTLKQPADAAEQHLLAKYCREHYNIQPLSPLSHTQVQDLLHVLFRHRASHLVTQGETEPPELWWHSLPPILQPFAQRPLFCTCLLVLLALLLWFLL